MAIAKSSRIPVYFQRQQERAATRDLTAQAKYENRNFKLEIFKAVLGIGPVIVAVVAAYLSYLEYIHQRQREQDFQVTQELLEVFLRFNSSDPREQVDAALSLGFYGKDASDYLLYRIENAPHGEVVRRAMYDSLERIALRGADAASHITRVLRKKIEANAWRILTDQQADNDPLDKLVATMIFLGQDRTLDLKTRRRVQANLDEIIQTVHKIVTIPTARQSKKDEIIKLLEVAKQAIARTF